MQGKDAEMQRVPNGSECVMCDEQWMQEILARRREEGTFRELRTPEQDQCFVDFTSNDYLGLGRAAGLRQATEVEASRARKVTGTGPPSRMAVAGQESRGCSPFAITITLSEGEEGGRKPWEAC